MILNQNNTSNNNELPVTYGTKEIAEILHCSIPTARETMHSKGFPLMRIGKNFRVYREDFIKWMNQQGERGIYN